MSFEFSNRIEELTNKLTQAQKNKDSRIEEAKQQLLTLQNFLAKELTTAEKRMKKIENKLQRRVTRASRQSESVDEIVEIKEERVTQVINGWISEYEQRLDLAKEDLKREQLLFKTKLEEQQSYYDKETKMMQDKIKNQLKTLQKEMSKWQNIHQQGQSTVSKEIESYKQMMLRDLSVSREMKEREMIALENKIKKIKDNQTEKIEQFRKKMDKQELKTRHIFELLLHV